ncbi:MAG: hypothetical protein GDA53_06255 [Rhodobacteraceae bacterium]|nr:hypothetical protein [Paracoccaceae bacterium]
MKCHNDRQCDLILTSGDIANFAVRDNGSGIANLDELFELFYTTNKPGDGVGPGLAVSLGIAKDPDGRLLAGNGRESGANV